MSQPEEQMNTGTGSRRATKGEALNAFFIVFTLAMMLGLLSDLIWDGAPDFENSFYRAVLLAVVLAAASLVFKLRGGARPY